MNKIRFLRNELNLSVRGAALIFEMSSSIINQYENDVRDLNTKMIRKMADYFQVSTDYLLCYSNLGLYVHYKDSNLKFLVTEADYLKYKESGFIYYEGHKRYIDVNKKLNLSMRFNLSNLLETFASYDDLEEFVKKDTINLPVPLNKSSVIKKIITLNDEKFKVIKQMLDVM